MNSFEEVEELVLRGFADVVDKLPRNLMMRGVAVLGGPKHLLVRWGNKVLQRPTASAFLQVAVVEIVGESRRRYSAAFVARHCTSDLDYKC